MSEILRTEYPRSRGGVACCMCGTRIPPGRRYQRTEAADVGTVVTARVCADCVMCTALCARYYWVQPGDDAPTADDLRRWAHDVLAEPAAPTSDHGLIALAAARRYLSRTSPTHSTSDLRGLMAASATSLREAAAYLVDRYAAGADEEAEIRAVLEPVADALAEHQWQGEEKR